MVKSYKSSLGRACSAMAILAVAAPTFAQSADSDNAGGADIVVTATKREQKLQDVGLTVTALGSETLANRRVANVEDLSKSVPGLSFAPSPNATPVYTLRGVGFYESSIAAYPDVAVYIDQAPLVVPAMTSLTAFDLERVEVMKGPQGTLFGNNATGGGINFIAAKPTDTFKAGVELGYARFNTLEASGFVSGPLAENLNARLAVKATKGDEWQKSYTRNDKLGKTNEVAARFLVDWQPTDRLKINLNLNAWRDRSEPQAPAIYNEFGNTATYRFDALGNLVPGGTIQSPYNAVLGALTPDVGNDGLPRTASPFFGYPLAPRNPRAADWTPEKRPYANNRFWQAAARIDYDLLDTVALTSITGYATYRHLNGTEADGTKWNAIDLVRDWGKVKSFTQELRLASADKTSPLNWVIGGNYERTSADEVIDNTYYDASSSHGGVFQGFTANTYGSLQDMTNYAIFGNAEYKVTEMITVKGGIRYTEAERKAVNYNRSTPGYVEPTPAVDPGITPFFNGTWGALTSALPLSIICPGFSGTYTGYVPVADGESFTLDPNTCQAETFHGKLKEHNTSWSLGVDIKPVDDVLIYANVSRGFKAGSYPMVSAATTNQFAPVVQEKVTNYEIGFKSTIRSLNMTINGAAFYNDYRNKQVRAKIVDRIFGYLDALQNVPKSQIKGAELEIGMRPFDGLNVNLAGTYLKTKVKNYVGADPNFYEGEFGNRTPIPLDFAGAKLPFTPKIQVSANFDYTVPVSENWNAIVGASVSAQSKTISGLYAAGDTVSETTYKINGRTLIDAMVGLKSNDGWKVTVWGKNITNKYYWTNATLSYDTNVRYAGRPAEYGMTVGYSF